MKCKYKNCNEKCYVTPFGKVRRLCRFHLDYFRDWKRANKYRTV